MKCFQFAIVLFLSVAASILAQSSEPATQIRKFELDWLTASLNGDPKWEQRFLDGKLDVAAADANGAQQRNVEIAEMLRTPLSANLIKVRITGSISLLTSDPAQNRSFRFLDTFNKKNGKWQVIATSIAPAQETASTGIDRDQIEHELTRLENAWAQVDVTNDRSIFKQIIALDFVATDSRGVLDRDQWLKQWEYEGVKNAVNKGLIVHVYSDSLAVVTGIDVTTRVEDGRAVTREDRFTDTWINRNGQWQVVAAQVQRLK